MFVGSSDFDKDVLCRELDLGVFRVDDGWKGAYDTVGIKDDGVDRGVADDVKVFIKMFVVLCSTFSRSFKVLFSRYMN